MRGLGGFLAANLFLLAVLVIGIACMWLAWSAVGLLHLSTDAEAWLILPAGAAALVATYYSCRSLHRLIERAVNRRR